MNLTYPDTRPDIALGDRRLRVLVVDDDADVVAFLVENLTADRFDVFSAASGADALREVVAQAPDLLLVDEGLPDMSGLDVITTIRLGGPSAEWDVALPIIMITGRCDEQSVIRGLQRGADDYLTKPFRYPELLARVSAHLRRACGLSGVARLSVGPLEIDRRACTATVYGTPLALCAKEFSLLTVLASDPSRAIPKAELLRDVWGFARPPQRTRTVDTHASRLRRKLEQAGLDGWVRNLWGFGYRLLPQEG